tara:strand:+ start:134 stop:307 length:174 start_codon:yes stop_codon:yes gene_type:complete
MLVVIGMVVLDAVNVDTSAQLNFQEILGNVLKLHVTLLLELNVMVHYGYGVITLMVN